MLSTAEGDVDIQRALQAGTRGYLLKTMPPKDLLDAIRQVHAGNIHVPPPVAVTVASHLAEESLTERETEVVRFAAGNRKP
jgi:DNA-binding NarL/FixJ family response regulator